MSDDNRANWRELCAAAAKELDSEKLISLVNQILQDFDSQFDNRDPGAIFSVRSTSAAPDVS